MLRWFQNHKKLTATIVGAAVQFVPGIPQGTKDDVTKLILAYIVGQGVADHGKEKAKVEAYASSRPVK